jgi:hypothetical protein
MQNSITFGAANTHKFYGKSGEGRKTFFANKYHKSDRDIMGFRAYENIISREVCANTHSQDGARGKEEGNLSPFYKVSSVSKQKAQLR